MTFLRESVHEKLLGQALESILDYSGDPFEEKMVLDSCIPNPKLKD